MNPPVHPTEVCRFCGSPATVHVLLSDGCVCFREDKQQWLCEQHWINLEPIGSCRVDIDLLHPL